MARKWLSPEGAAELRAISGQASLDRRIHMVQDIARILATYEQPPTCPSKCRVLTAPVYCELPIGHEGWHSNGGDNTELHLAWRDDAPRRR